MFSCGIKELFGDVGEFLFLFASLPILEHSLPRQVSLKLDGKPRTTCLVKLQLCKPSDGEEY